MRTAIFLTLICLITGPASLRASAADEKGHPVKPILARDGGNHGNGVPPETGLGYVGAKTPPIEQKPHAAVTWRLKNHIRATGRVEFATGKARRYFEPGLYLLIRDQEQQRKLAEWLLAPRTPERMSILKRVALWRGDSGLDCTKEGAIFCEMLRDYRLLNGEHSSGGVGHTFGAASLAPYDPDDYQDVANSLGVQARIEVARTFNSCPTCRESDFLPMPATGLRFGLSCAIKAGPYSQEIPVPLNHPEAIVNSWQDSPVDLHAEPSNSTVSDVLRLEICDRVAKGYPPGSVTFRCELSSEPESALREVFDEAYAFPLRFERDLKFKKVADAIDIRKYRPRVALVAIHPSGDASWARDHRRIKLEDESTKPTVLFRTEDEVVELFARLLLEAAQAPWPSTGSPQP